MEENIAREIKELHTFFQDWFAGSLPASSLERLTAVLANDFHIITPKAEEIDREELINIIKNGRNSSSDRKIWADNVSVRKIHDVYVATYIEYQEFRKQVNKRLSTAIFTRNDNAPNSVVWHHVHETWLPSE